MAKGPAKSYQTGQLKNERKDRLNGIGVLWSDYERQRELRCQELLEYKETDGNCSVPTTSALA